MRNAVRFFRGRWPAGLVILAAGCLDAGGPIFPEETIDVRLVNAAAFDFVPRIGGVDQGGSLAFGMRSSCKSVSPTDHGIGIVRGDMSFALPVPVSAGGSVALVVAGDQTFVQFLPIERDLHPAAGQAALQLLTTVKGASLDLYLTTPGAPLGTPTLAAQSQGTIAGYKQVAPGTFEVKATTGGTQTVVADLGAMELAAGQMYAIVIGPGASAGAPYRFFTLRAEDFC
jgi:hypothetical protein